MSLLLLFGGGTPPIVTGQILSVLTPDEIAVGVEQRIWAMYLDNAGAHALDDAPQYSVVSVDTSGNRVVVASGAMAPSGDGYYADWTPTAAGAYWVTVAGEYSASSVFANANVTARPRFDPVALAVDGVLVARM